ncbi:anthranilate synthase/aminodeoxychorismate synthase-like glutamine amidotransferase [Alkalibacillus filiformis]|uniref:Anthranilate synthase/aminodeoxychorismate synthase-like glutamine amidotransferase n=1 Tax=Alkalibacillus filiformis TaxID=200990 RepID=A0ABU0DUE9_9BACI|nr:aminodeoxychorismate/anthranilate synthase component II [Alkalibacillus filiformis]MDQ0352086.1 anthranilate synthase/aminodeoxychorismate synthase-like glutamine amidotransferase [Alkalibacillus filiformis]
MILLIDHYDSFTYNLYQYIEELGFSVEVRRHDEINISEIKEMNVHAIVLSPGPGKPIHYEQSMNIVKELHTQIPILGICLGHQIIGATFGAQVKKASIIMHGKQSLILHKGQGLFEYLSQPLQVMRYHSLVIDEQTLPPYFKRKAISMDDDELMAIEHQTFPVFGIQFHPESIGTNEGKQILKQFLSKTRKENDHESTSKIS